MSLGAVSLFSGAGGLDVGFERAGVELLFANELDHDAAESWRLNRPDAVQTMAEGDICDYQERLKELASETDVVFGGPPCQGFSVAGKMDPNDERSKLVWAFMSSVKTLSPKLFVMENVKALGALAKWSDVRTRLIQLAEESGYGHASFILNAADYGVPQARERFFFVGLKDAPCNWLHAAIAKHLENHRLPLITVREAFAGLPRFGMPGNDKGSTAEIRLAKNPILRKSPYDGSLLFNGHGRPIKLDSVAKTIPAQMGGNHTPIVDQALIDDPSGFDWVTNYHERLTRGLITPDEAQLEIPSTLRRLSIAEAAALQSFPDGYLFYGRQNKQYRQIGNAVPCKLAFAVAASAISALVDFDHKLAK